MKNRKTIYGLVITLLISMLVSSSIVFGAEVTDSITCMNVDGSGVATGVSSDFLATTPYIFVRSTFSNLLSGQMITFGWEIPGGGGWDSNVITATSETTYWDSIPIEGDLAATFVGTWTVKIYVDDELEDTVNFNIVDYTDLLGDIQGLILQIQDANNQALLWQSELGDLEARTTAIEANYSSVLAQNLIIQNELTTKISEFSSLESDYNTLSLDYNQTQQELEEVKNDLNDLKNQSGDNTILYLAIGAAAVAILAAAYFYTKSR